MAAPRAPVAAAPSAGSKEEAATRFDRGVKFYDAGDYKAALAEFEAAYRAVPASVLFYNIGLAERRLFRYNDAVRAFGRYLDEGGDRIPAERRQRVAEELAEVRALVAEVAVRVDGAPALVEVDGVAAGRTPLDGPLLLSPGHHLIAAVREGEEPAKKELAVISGQRVEVTLAPQRRVTTATLSVHSKPPGAELFVDGRFAGREPWSGTLEPGGHEVRAQLAGHEMARAELVLTAGQSRDLLVELAPLPPPTKWYKRWYTWTLAGVLVAGAVGAGVGGYIATHPGPDLAIDFRAR